MAYKNFLIGLLIIAVSFGMLGVTANAYETEYKMESHITSDTVDKESVSFASLSEVEQKQFKQSIKEPTKKNADSFTDKYTYIQYQGDLYKTEIGEYIVNGITQFLLTLSFFCLANLLVLEERDLPATEFNFFLLRFYGISIAVFVVLFSVGY